MNFMNLPKEFCTEKSRFCVMPIEYEGKVSWKKGASKGGIEIINASRQLEYYDEQFNTEPFLQGIQTFPKLSIANMNEERAVGLIEKKISKIELQNKFPIFLGGDHSVTIGIVRAMEKLNDDFLVIILDAHSDLRESWNNSRFNHACTAKRINEKHDLLIIGLRAQDIDEHEFMKKSKNVRAIRAYEYSKDKLIKELTHLKKNVYVSVDADVFDPAFIRNTGTPEPGGFFWNDMIEILEEIFKRKNVIAADIVEFAPMGKRENFSAEAFALAKLCYKIIALKTMSKNR